MKMTKIALYAPFALAFSISLFAPCQASTPQNKAQEPDAVRFAPDVIEPFGAPFKSSTQPSPDQTKVLIYRQGPQSLAVPANIYIDKRYHTSLLRGGYSEFCTSPGHGNLLAVMNDAQQMHMGKHAQAQKWGLQAGQTLFLRVEENGQLTEIKAEQAGRELILTALQTHTISRSPLVQDCKPLPRTPVQTPVAALSAPPVIQDSNTKSTTPAKPQTVAPTKPQIPRLYALESDALFDFGKTQLRAKGYNTIEIMAQKLRQDFAEVERIRVIGHSDPIGQSASNRKLSLARAQVVADQLKERGVKPTKGFQIEGEGSHQLVRVNCGNTATAANKLCHAPNRRVDIVVTGAKR